MLKIFIPSETGICRIAADAFSSLWFQVTGQRLAVTTEPDSQGDLIVLGSDAVNAYAFEKIIDNTIRDFSITTDADDYEIVSATDNGRKLLFLAGGRPRALLYAVYRFFELRADCRYFWDGDIVPKREHIDISDLHIHEKPRFEYRGLRYFAHRGLNRFQAEHWSFDEWKQEIDWIIKKRMNLFMLRIGFDDLFQKAFPDIVSDPGYEVPESIERSYNDRDLFWSMEIRSELRRKILAYARERDLIHPEDTGTMTHWYSRTPKDYLEKVKPDFLPQTTSSYSEDTGLVWDIRQDRHLDAYFQLTEAHIREYGSPEMFHTIGLAERLCYADRKSNQQLKRYAYRRIISNLRSKYPNAPLLVASWDFPMRWTSPEVRELLAELNPLNTLLFDYTSDSGDEENTFQDWGVVGKFPWIFGIFHAYAPNTELRGNYDALERRLPIAADDPMCKGMVLWPECSHSDTLMLEYLAANAWDPSADNITIRSFLESFCSSRYPTQGAEMASLWRAMLPIISIRYWSHQFSEVFFAPLDQLFKRGETLVDHADAFIESHREPIRAVPEIFRALAAMPFEDAHAFVQRDMIDMARTAATRVLSFGYFRVVRELHGWSDGEGNRDHILAMMAANRTMVSLLGDLLAADNTYSLYASLQDLGEKYPCNPKFEKTLKGNVENNYCRTYVTELFKAVYLPEHDVATQKIQEHLDAGHRPWPTYSEAEIIEWQKRVADSFYERPLKDMAPDQQKAVEGLSKCLNAMADGTEAIIDIANRVKEVTHGNIE
ncbi:alpha-N-acetylglucosaminidase TIM-barrel domain-containing protein [Phycisphaerales bacterium AB-hyl4]|uniref:Alpha-N-acetylglucosaminidase TIM-barrel domain-containing protein n=1 Tax=Natronomicrosphaera hydrolytica TaxID=3242702 RepID=A0ABV4U5E7_9BACT